MTAVRRRVRSAGPCPLEPRDVERVVHSRAASTARSTVDITDMCRAAHPHYPNINTWRVGKLLDYLFVRDRVAKLSGDTDADRLEGLGVPAPHRQWSYWTAPATASRTGHGRVEDAVYPDLPATGGDRVAFDARPGDPAHGTVRDLTDTGHPGWWQRRGDRWIPVARPGRADT